MNETKKQPTKLAFCAREQKEMVHVLSHARNDEVILSCECGEFIKFHKGIGRDEIDELLVKHKAANMGQEATISDEEKEKQLDELAD